MPTDYLAELMKDAKLKDTGKIEEKEVPTKPEDKEEQLAHEAGKKQMESFNETFEIEPSDQKAETEKELEQGKKIQLKSYGNVKIFQIPGKPLNYYYVPTIRPSAVERKIINTIKEATTRLVSIASYKIRNPEERRIIYKQKIIEIIQNNPSLNIPESRVNYYADAVVREMVGYGLIDELIKDDNLEEIMIIGPQKPVYVFHREFEMMTTNVEFFSEQEIEDLINRIAREVGRRVDVSSPLLDARLIDGSRVNATIPPASISGGTLTIRKFRQDPYSIIDLVKMGTLSSEAAAFLWVCADGLGTKPANILISGGTGSGKTTLLNVLASFIPDRERVITIEDTAELNLPIKHWIRMEARPPGIEGTGELKIDILTKNSLRMRPDRIIVGEIRHEEAFTLFTAINTGHDGATTEDTLIQMDDGNIIEIGKLAEKYMTTPTKEKEYEFSEINEPLLVPSFNKKTLQIEPKQITKIWRKKVTEMLLKIKLKSGKEITITQDHPFYVAHNGIQEINAERLQKGDFICTPEKIPLFAERKLIEPHLVGLIYGDGHVGQEVIEFVNAEKQLVNSFIESAKNVTQNKITQKSYDRYNRALFYDKKFIRAMTKEYNIPQGNKTKSFKLGEEILCAEQSELAQLVKGLFDSESHVNLHSNSIQFVTSNKDLANKLPLILQRYGIKSSKYIQQKDGKGNTGPYYKISIYGLENLKQYKTYIGYEHTKKRETLDTLLKKAKLSVNVIPGLSKVLINARAENNLTQKELSALLGNSTPSVISAYETNQRNPTKEQIKKIGQTINGETAKQLSRLAESKILFEEITEIKEIKHEGYVYDLTVKDNHTYIANGTIISNCMGTVHANSPQETIIRVTNPPMNVPQIMLSGLDFIIVEHRYYDRKKGTIRRVSEIAEVYGALEGKPRVQTVFARDPVKDKLEKTILDSSYLKTLQDFTGLSREQIEAEIQIRKQFLEKLIEKNIRGLTQVSEETKEFLGKRKIFGEQQ